MGKLDRKVALITGGGVGIGKGIALEFAKEGANIAIASRNLANLEKTAAEVKALGRYAIAIATDVRVKEQVQKMVKRTVDEFGRIDILVNNSGVLHRFPSLLEVTEESWDTVIDTNLKSVFLCTQAVAPYMIKQKYGKIINLSSVAGRGWNYPGFASYPASKAGVSELTKCYAKELGPYNINVNAMAPGAIVTEIMSRGRTPEEFAAVQEGFKKVAVLGKVGYPEDVAKLALFLASEDSSFITGQTIPIDGGRTDRM